MKSIFAALVIALSFNAAQAADKCSESDKNIAIQGYLAAIRGKSQTAAEFKKRVGALVQQGVQNDLFDLGDISAVCIQQGASMHSGQTSSLSTFLISHKLRVGNAGITNDASVLSTIGVHAESGDDGAGERVEVSDLRFVDLK